MDDARTSREDEEDTQWDMPPPPQPKRKIKQSEAPAVCIPALSYTSVRLTDTNFSGQKKRKAASHEKLTPTGSRADPLVVTANSDSSLEYVDPKPSRSKTSALEETGSVSVDGKALFKAMMAGGSSTVETTELDSCMCFALQFVSNTITNTHSSQGYY